MKLIKYEVDNGIGGFREPKFKKREFEVEETPKLFKHSSRQFKKEHCDIAYSEYGSICYLDSKGLSEDEVKEKLQILLRSVIIKENEGHIKTMKTLANMNNILK